MRQIRNMEELKMAQVEIKHKIAIKEMQLQAHTNAIREMFNPMTYVNRAISKLGSIENLITSFYSGYHKVREMIAKYRNVNNGDEIEAEGEDPTQSN